jgi:hypothetical protein
LKILVFFGLFLQFSEVLVGWLYQVHRYFVLFDLKIDFLQGDP